MCFICIILAFSIQISKLLVKRALAFDCAIVAGPADIKCGMPRQRLKDLDHFINLLSQV
jgi:hypothetical protein